MVGIHLIALYRHLNDYKLTKSKIVVAVMHMDGMLNRGDFAP